MANVVVLALWTLLDPMVYVRRAHPGTDGWNRVISTYGSCQSENSPLPFLIPLAVLNMGVLIIANWQAYRARHIQCEFSESTYIGFVMAILLQAALAGAPLLFVVNDNPRAYYLILTSMIFIVNMSILLLIFVPKVRLTEQFRRQSAGAQTRIIEDSVRLSQQRTAEYRRRGSSLRNLRSNSSDNFRMSFSANNGVCAVCRQVRPLSGVMVGTEHMRPLPPQQELEAMDSSSRTGSGGVPPTSNKKDEDSGDWYEAELPSQVQFEENTDDVLAENETSFAARSATNHFIDEDEKSEELSANCSCTAAMEESSDSIFKVGNW